MMYRMVTTRGAVYMLDADGYVLSRSDGPKGWDYGKGWQIMGASTRYNARIVASLAAIIRDGVPGQGWVHDWDHGTYRRWGDERMRSLEIVTD